VSKSQQKYIHALRYSWLNSIYDSVVKVTTRDDYVKSELVEEIPRKAEFILDVAAGTGTLSRKISKSLPLAQVTGVDGDADMVRRARLLAVRAGMNVHYDESLAQALPYASDSFDVVTTSLFLHHLEHAAKRIVLAEIYRVTRTGGIIIVSDWGEPTNWFIRLRFLIVRCLDGFDTTRDNVKGLLPELVADAGFSDVSTIKNTSTPLGTVSLIKGLK
tara:strand:+ start:5036 stop:5686 length:651 start_codon:yes stop_codon:yes gene_type:complete